jgi:hypothetical protein
LSATQPSVMVYQIMELADGRTEYASKRWHIQRVSMTGEGRNMFPSMQRIIDEDGEGYATATEAAVALARWLSGGNA